MGLPTYCRVVTAIENVTNSTTVAFVCNRNTAESIFTWFTCTRRRWFSAMVSVQRVSHCDVNKMARILVGFSTFPPIVRATNSDWEYRVGWLVSWISYKYGLRLRLRYARKGVGGRAWLYVRMIGAQQHNEKWWRKRNWSTDEWQKWNVGAGRCIFLFVGVYVVVTSNFVHGTVAEYW